jgi:cell shape-determining protein MreC
MSTTSEIVERLNELAQNEAECGFMTEAYDLRAAAARLSELERENARLRAELEEKL